MCTKTKILRFPSPSKVAPYGELNGTGTWIERAKHAEMRVPETSMSDLEASKKAAAEKAVEYVHDGMVVGLGTGSTAKHMILALGERVRAGLSIRGVPTSLETAELARKNGIPLLETEDAWTIDVAIDGADQVDAQLNLIKGGGGALLREKIVAAAARQFIVIVDHTKRASVLGHPEIGSAHV